MSEKPEWYEEELRKVRENAPAEAARFREKLDASCDKPPIKFPEQFARNVAEFYRRLAEIESDPPPSR